MPPTILKPKQPAKKVVLKSRGNPDGPIKVAFDHATIEKFSNVFEEVEEEFVERGEELEAIKYCLLTRSHVMLEGLHGTGKSKLAESVFGRIKGGAFFKKMFMKMTERDEIFGPMFSELYRTKGVYQHNINGHLPTAHFAFLDEVYRASDFLLPATLNILNERQFMNGTIQVECPLMTAIGTTNFVSNSDELEAFHDRWHVRVKVLPLSNTSSVTRMLAGFLEGPIEYEDPAEIELTELRQLQDSVRRIIVPEDIVGMYAEVVQGMQKQLGYISDRRKNLALRFVQASALLRESMEANSDDVAAAKYMLMEIRNEDHEKKWNSVFGNQKSTFDSFNAENVLLKRLEKWIKISEGKFDPDMPKKDAQALWQEVQTGHSSFENQPQADQPKTDQGKARKEALMRKMQNLLDSLAPLVRM